MSTPTLREIRGHSETEAFLGWDTGERFSLPYVELRYECPCAACVDEMTGRRTLQREAVARDVKPWQVRPVGNYALVFMWSDRHGTGMYPYELLYRLCGEKGAKLA